MNSKKSDLRFILLLVASLLVTCASALYSSTAYLPANEVGITAVNDSEYHQITVWGAPFHFVFDMQNSQSIDHIDRQDRFSGGAFLANWPVWFALSWPLYYAISILPAFFVRFAREFANPTQEK